MSYDDILGPRPENSKEDKPKLPDGYYMEIDDSDVEEGMKDLTMDDQKDDPDFDAWGDVDTSNNADLPDTDDCDDSCDGCGC